MPWLSSTMVTMTSGRSDGRARQAPPHASRGLWARGQCSPRGAPHCQGLGIEEGGAGSGQPVVSPRTPAEELDLTYPHSKGTGEDLEQEGALAKVSFGRWPSQWLEQST